jgi:hypothetical protein
MAKNLICTVCSQGIMDLYKNVVEYDCGHCEHLQCYQQYYPKNRVCLIYRTNLQFYLNFYFLLLNISSARSKISTSHLRKKQMANNTSELPQKRTQIVINIFFFRKRKWNVYILTHRFLCVLSYNNISSTKREVYLPDKWIIIFISMKQFIILIHMLPLSWLNSYESSWKDSMPLEY